MKVYLPFVALVVFLWICFVNGCTKEPIIDNSTYPVTPLLPAPPYLKGSVISESFKENFDGNYQFAGWVFNKENSEPNLYGILWTTAGNPGGKYATTPVGSPSDSKFAYIYRYDSIKTSTWMMTPAIQLKNGDKLSFVTIADTAGSSSGVHGLEVRLNETDSTTDVGKTVLSVGKFTKLLGAITSYPRIWTRVEYVISGLSAPLLSRIGFRYNATERKPGGSIGIDDITFTKQ